MEPRQLGQQLRRLREWHERTLTEVARQVGISKALLSLAEQGKRRLPFKVLRHLLSLYGASFAMLGSSVCPVARSAYGGQVWQGTNLLAVVTDRSLQGSVLRLLRPVQSSEDAEWLELCLRAGSQLPPEGYWSFPTPTNGIAIDGNLLVEMPGDELLIRSGESFHIRAQQPHCYRNYLSTSIRALLVLQHAVL
ncbi:MAG: helix-turn-helix domain-containing protein [Candidatus Kapabacteria bacterium]|nr:helix-turn-helix domain-containing protein [Candidatus Kapabacteria bacterium]MCS7169527.1 helix-turn-helix domain-containing protein [Candidatus Kapabacteria bacterium]MDW7997640.1 helix-turn-helix domain-containing protein [Bacteroidota bacterium]MDW8224629.1 helix-turn-helix domain-containing protein [Bacteroidota bacterium]